MNITTQYGAGLRTGILIGAGTCALALITLVAIGSAADRATITHSIGSINTDRLGGIGSSKSVAGIDLAIDRRDYIVGVRLWRIAEKLDDDAGISPVSGATVDIDWRWPGPWRTGLLLASADDNRFGYATAGVGSKHADAALLIPLNDSRFGLRARLRAPLSGGWHAQAHYEYTGRQDPDIKIVNVGLGIGRSF